MLKVATAVLLALALVGVPQGDRGRPPSPGAFAAQIEALSEPGGYFDTDNLISNERSYLDVISELDRLKVHGGAYVGVGPDQNFSYIAATRPAIAFIVDIRRDNLLLHLLFKALFAEARTRIEYLALLLGRPLPAGVESWRDASIARMTEYLGRPPLEATDVDALRARLDRVVRGFGVPLSAEDFRTVDRFHRRFIERGLALQFQSAGRAPQSRYPTYGELLLEADEEGKQRNYLASEEAFQFVRMLQQRDRVVPVVGNLGGSSALAAIARLLRDRGEPLSVFYASNVEFYLDREGTSPRFVANLAGMPRTSRSVIIRSLFGRGSGGSISVVEPVEALLARSGAMR